MHGNRLIDCLLVLSENQFWFRRAYQAFGVPILYRLHFDGVSDVDENFGLRQFGFFGTLYIYIYILCWNNLWVYENIFSVFTAREKPQHINQHLLIEFCDGGTLYPQATISNVIAPSPTLYTYTSVKAVNVNIVVRSDAPMWYAVYYITPSHSNSELIT